MGPELAPVTKAAFPVGNRAPVTMIDAPVQPELSANGAVKEAAAYVGTANSAAAAPLLAAHAHGVASEKLNILIVDDAPGKLVAHDSVLQELGENVIKASSGREALQQLLKREFAVILLDVNMPEMDGFETAAMIRQHPKYEHTPILFVTAYNTSDLDRLKGYDIGAADYIFLPLNPALLKAKVKVFLEVARQRRIIQAQAEALATQNEQQQLQIRVIQELNKKLQTANEELEAFSYSVSHDLRSPLRAMQGYSHALLEDYTSKLEPQAVEYLQRINKAAVRMDGLVQDVLAYTRLTKAEIQLSRIDLDSLLREIIRDSRGLIQSKAQITLRSPLHPVIGHEACLTQCLSNLLENSAKFVSPGTLPDIKVRTDRHGKVVRVWVEDNGIGIDPNHHNRIFQMFGRVHHSSTYEGTGMGLTIVKKAVERMGGSLGLESKLGDGCRFWIELPAADS